MDLESRPDRSCLRVHPLHCCHGESRLYGEKVGASNDAAGLQITRMGSDPRPVLNREVMRFAQELQVMSEGETNSNDRSFRPEELGGHSCHLTDAEGTV
jgi:hypothetical protein